MTFTLAIRLIAGHRTLPRRIIFPTIFTLSFFLLSPLPISAEPPELNISSETILRIFERENQDDDQFSVIPVYEYLNFDYGDPEAGGLSLHGNGWARADLGDQEYYENDTEGYILDGYAQYSNPATGLDLKLGRQHLYSGIVNNSVDGISFQGYAGSHVSMLAYAGYPVGYEDENGRTGDSTYGGRVGLEQFFPGEFGLSYKMLTNDNETIENKLGGDLSLHLFSRLVISGLSVWNFDTEDWEEHTYSADVYVNQFSLKARYQRFQYEDYFSGKSNSQLLNYLEDTDETLTILGGDIIWQQFHGFDAGLKLNHYTFDQRGETSRYVAMVMNAYGQAQTTFGAEAGFMDGESSETSYYLGRIYVYWDAPSSIMENWFLDGEFMVVFYKKEIYDRDNSIFSSAGCGRNIIDDRLKIKFSGDYSSDPYHDSDFRFMTVVQFEY